MKLHDVLEQADRALLAATLAQMQGNDKRKVVIAKALQNLLNSTPIEGYYGEGCEVFIHEESGVLIASVRCHGNQDVYSMGLSPFGAIKNLDVNPADIERYGIQEMATKISLEALFYGDSDEDKENTVRILRERSKGPVIPHEWAKDRIALFNLKNLAFMGPQGSGKGTQASTLAERLGYTHVDFGLEFRKMLREKDPDVLPYTQEKYDRGELAPDEVLFRIAKRIVPKDKFILDGFPRTVGQAEWVRRNRPIQGLVVLELPDDSCMHRMATRGRSDDSGDAARRRLGIYRESSQKLIDGLQARDVIQVDADASVPEVTDRILLGLKAKSWMVAERPIGVKIPNN